MANQSEALSDLNRDDVSTGKIAEHLQSGKLVRVHASLLCLDRLLGTPQSSDRQPELLEILPKGLAGFSHECQKLIVKAWRHAPVTVRLPDLNVAGLPRDIVVEWAVTQLLRDFGADVGDEQILMAAVARLDWNQAADPNKLFQRLAELRGSATQLLLAQQLANSVVDGTIAVAQASRYLIKMLAADTDVVVLAAL